jgi:excisionase family DNA binding protein
MSADLAQLRQVGSLEGLRAILAETAQEDLPLLIGALETTKTEAQLRLLGTTVRLVARDLDEMLTVQTVALHLKRSDNYVRAQCHKGHLKAMRDGRDWRIRQSALAAYERRRTK